MIRPRASSSPVLLALILLFAWSCGDGGGASLEKCGNGVLNEGEECDDGNRVDNDSCLGNCQIPVCGDGIIWTGVEDCDLQVPGDASCRTLGFNSGTLTCGGNCFFDTSGCTGTAPGTPTPVVTPTFIFGSPTPTPTGGTPVPTPTPGTGGECPASGQVAVTITLDTDYGAAVIDLQYPGAEINLPGSGSGPDVSSRVVFAANGGLTTVNDNDNTSTLTTSFVSFNQQTAGLFATVTFDCVTDVPAPSAFVCTVVSASTPGGVAIPGAQCAANVP